MKKLFVFLIMMLMIMTALSGVGMINEYSNVRFKIESVEDLMNYDYVPGEFIIKFKEPPISSLSLIELINKYDIFKMEKRYDNAENTPLDNIYKFYLPINADIISVVDDYVSLPNVEYALPNYITKIDIFPENQQKSISRDPKEIKTFTTPNDPLFNQQWNLENTGQYGGTPGCDIGALEAWDIETGSEEIVIAIIDTGVDYTHPDLIDNIWVNEDEIPDNELDDDGNGYVDDIHGYDFSNLGNDGIPLDVQGHGTFCAGIAAAVTNNGIGISGVSWNSKIMCLQIYDKYFTVIYDIWVEGIKYTVDNGADILSLSLGWEDHAFVKSGYEYAYEKGAVLVAAAGNFNTSDTRFYYPAAYDFTIAVAATNQRDERCDGDDWGYSDFGDEYGSNFGYWVDVAAPGHNFTGTSPTYDVENEWYNLTYTDTEGGGTSWSAPTVAGIAALLLSQDPTLTNDEVRRIIRANVDSYISEEYIGTGRVNALKALTRVNTQPETPAISGDTNGKPGREYSFTTSASDDDGDELLYYWDWGDGNYSEWLGPYASGEECEASYTWQQEANFSIKVKVKDGKGGESYWSEEFIFSTPKNKMLDNALFEGLVSRFPILKIIISNLVERKNI